MQSVVLLQTDVAAGFLGQVVQAGIAFAIMAMIIYVLARRVVKLEIKTEANKEVFVIESKPEPEMEIDQLSGDVAEKKSQPNF